MGDRDRLAATLRIRAFAGKRRVDFDQPSGTLLLDGGPHEARKQGVRSMRTWVWSASRYSRWAATNSGL